MKLSCVPQHASDDAGEPLVAVGSSDSLRRGGAQARPEALITTTTTATCAIAGEDGAANMCGNPVNTRLVGGDSMSGESFPNALTGSVTAAAGSPSPTLRPIPVCPTTARSPLHVSYESLLRYVRRQLPSRATPEAKMMFLQEKDALLERRAKALARTQVWGSTFALITDAAGPLAVHRCGPPLGDWMMPATVPHTAATPTAAATEMGQAGESAHARWRGPLAALHLSPRPITLPWGGGGSGGAEAAAKTPTSGKFASSRGDGSGSSPVTPPPPPPQAAAAPSGHPITRVVRMTSDPESVTELSFELVFRPSLSNPTQPWVPASLAEAAAESPTPDEFYEVMRHVPFVLTYLHGDNDLAPEASRLAYAVPVAAPPTARDSAPLTDTLGEGRADRRGGGEAGGLHHRPSSYTRGTTSPMERSLDTMAGVAALSPTWGPRPFEGFARAQETDPPAPTPATAGDGAGTHTEDGGPDEDGGRSPHGESPSGSGGALAARAMRRGAAVQRMNRRWRVVFPDVRLARVPDPQSVHVLFVSQAPTRYGEVYGMEIPMVTMEPPRIRLRLQRRPLPALAPSTDRPTVEGRGDGDAGLSGKSPVSAATSSAEGELDEDTFVDLVPEGRTGDGEGERGASTGPPTLTPASTGAGVYTLFSEGAGPLMCRALLDIEADDIVFDVEFSIRALVGGHRAMSTYAKEFMPSELIRYVHVPSPSPSSDDDNDNDEVVVRKGADTGGGTEGGMEGKAARPLGAQSDPTGKDWWCPVNTRWGGAPSSPTRPQADGGAEVIRTRWVIPIVAPLTGPPPPPCARRSPLISSTAVSTTAHGRGGSAAVPLMNTLDVAAPPLRDTSADSRAGSGSGPGRPHHTPHSPSLQGRVGRLVLQVDVRLASLPRQVFRETFPLHVVWPPGEVGGSLVGSRRASEYNTPAQVPEWAAPPPPALTLDGSTAGVEPPRVVAAAAALSAAELAVGGLPVFDELRPQPPPPPPPPQQQQQLLLSCAGDAFLRPPSLSAHTPSARSLREGSLDERSDGGGPVAATAAEETISPATLAAQSGGGGGGGVVGSGGRGCPRLHMERITEDSAPQPLGTPTSLRLRRSAGTSRSPSPTASPAVSSGSTRKISLAHLCVSAFAIGRSGAILTFYRPAYPDETQLGFSPLNSMSQCAPVHLHGMEKFTALQGERRESRADPTRRTAGGRRDAKAPERARGPADAAGERAATGSDSPKPLRADAKRRVHHHHDHPHPHPSRRESGQVRWKSGGPSRAPETVAAAADDDESRGHRRADEGAVGWRLERSIDANYVLLRERGACQCFAFRIKGSRARHGGGSGGGAEAPPTTAGKSVNRVDLTAVACFEPELPPLKGFTSASTDGKPVTVRRPVKQQYLLSDKEVLTLTIAGALLLTEASTVERARGEDAEATPGGGSRAALPPPSGPTLRAGRTRTLPLPGPCSRFTAWMLENDDGLTLLLIATAEVAGEGAGSAAVHVDAMRSPAEACGTSPPPPPAPPSSDGGAPVPHRRVLVYCVEESSVIYEFALGVPMGLHAPPRGEPETPMFPLTLPGACRSRGMAPDGPPSLPPSPTSTPARRVAATASIKGFTIVSAHEGTAMAVAWTSYQADVLTCCPAWARFSMFFVAPVGRGGGGGSGSGSARSGFSGGGRPPRTPGSGGISPLLAERSRSTLGRAKSTPGESERALVTILCVCPGDRAPHALVGAAADLAASGRGPAHAEGKAAGRRGSSSGTTYAEDYLAFFLLSNGSIYALVAPSGHSTRAAHREVLDSCPVRWDRGQLYVHVEDVPSPSVLSPNTAGAVGDVRHSSHRTLGAGGGSPTAGPPPARHGEEGGVLLATELWRTLRVVRVGTVFNSSFHTPSAVENCAMRYCPVDRDFLDVRGMLYLYATHVSSKELVKDAIIID